VLTNLSGKLGAEMDTDCTQCVLRYISLTGNSTWGALILTESIASTAIERGISYEEMQELIFDHKSHSEVGHKTH